MYLSLRDNCYGLIITASYWAFLSWRWMPHWTSLQLHSAPTAAISPKVLRLCGKRLLEFVFSHDASIFAYQSPNPLEEELQWVGKKKKTIIQVETVKQFQLNEHRTLPLMSYSSLLMLLLWKGQVESFRDAGVWAFADTKTAKISMRICGISRAIL